MSSFAFFVVFWIGILAILSLMISEEVADRRRDRMFIRNLQSERQRMARRYGIRLRD